MLISNTKDMLPKKIYLNYVDENDKDKTRSQSRSMTAKCRIVSTQI